MRRTLCPCDSEAWQEGYDTGRGWALAKAREMKAAGDSVKMITDYLSPMSTKYARYDFSGNTWSIDYGKGADAGVSSVIYDLMREEGIL